MPDVTSSLSSSVDVHSVAELVGIRVGETGDPWRLSLVQRGQVWRDTQVAYLLDSLLFGYPIGSFLLCTVHRGGSVLESEAGLRVRHEAPEGTWQLLDGQQRLNSLAWLFAGPVEPEQRRFVVRLDVSRDIDDVALRKRTQEQALRYVRPLGLGVELEERWRWLDVSGLHRAAPAGGSGTLQDVSGLSEEELLGWAERIDPSCRVEAWRSSTLEQRQRAAERVRRLLLAWYSPTVPVVKLRLDGPLDVLQVFARVNRTGTAVAGDDLFFAGVKTIWPDAEEHVVRFERASPLLRRTAALRVLARIASHEHTGNDLLPLDVERLHGVAGHELVGAMERHASARSRDIARIRDLSRLAIERSGLGYGLRSVPPALLDHLFVWATQREAWPPSDGELDHLWGYLVGASCFRYREVFAEPFDRLAFGLALQAGRTDQAFPTQAIATACLEKWPELRKGRQAVGPVATEEQRRRLVHDNRHLVLHIVQEVPFDLPPGRRFDLEHLYPLARINSMRWRGPEGGQRLQRHIGAWEVWRVGNLFVLDESLNRSAQHHWPHDKLVEYRAKGLWPPELFLSAEEEENLVESSRLFEKGEVVAGMPRFQAYVSSRELRAFDEIVRRYPLARVFAPPE